MCTGDSGPTRGRHTAQWFYPYLDRSNYLRVDRYDLPNGERKFYQHHWAGTSWALGVKGTYAERKIPYRLPELKAALQANPDVEVQICEGESDADVMARLGFVATTNPGGALSWTPELTSWLRTLGVRRAAIHEDDDKEAQGYKGPKRSALLTTELSGFIKLKIVRYPDVPKAKMCGGGSNTATPKKSWKRASPAEPATPPLPFINFANWDHEPIPEYLNGLFQTATRCARQFSPPAKRRWKKHLEAATRCRAHARRRLAGRLASTRAGALC